MNGVCGTCTYRVEMNAQHALPVAPSTGYYGFITQVIILGDGGCHPCSWPLLGKLVSKLEDARILLQHLGNLHLHGCSQLLPLPAGCRHREAQGGRGNSYLHRKDIQLHVGQKGQEAEVSN